MALYQQISNQIKLILSKNPSQQDLKASLSTILQKQQPKLCFHQTDLATIKQSTLFYVKLMVQDIGCECFTIPYIVQKPFSQKSRFYYFKYGHQEPDFKQQYTQDKQNYYAGFQQRETIVCTPVLYETQWVKDLNKNVLKDHMWRMNIDKIGEFKLGEIFSVVCVYQPEYKQLHFVRRATQNEIKLWQNKEQYLSKQVNYQETRQKLLFLFNKYYPQKYSKFLLYSLISTEHLFISASEANQKLFQKLLPQVCYVKIKFPFKQSLFPYKIQNEQQKLVRTPMQMSNDHTFVIFDFSEFSQEKKVEISPEEIDNLKALKVYVQQGNTIYRWLYGQSLIPHKNTGLIVSASSIVYPQYVIPTIKNDKKSEKQSVQSINQYIGLQSSFIQELTEANLRQIRSYIQQIRKINPLLKDDRQKIQNIIHEKPTKFNQNSLVKLMELAKLNARSKGRDQIKIQDFQHSCEIFF